MKAGTEGAVPSKVVHMVEKCSSNSKHHVLHEIRKKKGQLGSCMYSGSGFTGMFFLYCLKITYVSLSAT